MDADDVAHPDRLERQAERLERDRGVDVLGSPGRAPPADGGAALRGDARLRRVAERAPRPRRDGPRPVRRVAARPPLRGHAARGPASTSAAGAPSTAPRTTTCGCAPSRRGCASPSSARSCCGGATARRGFTRTDPRYAPGRFLALKLAALGGAPSPPPARPWCGARARWARPGRAPCCAAGHPVAAFVEVDPRKIGERIHGAPVVGRRRRVGPPGPSTSRRSARGAPASGSAPRRSGSASWRGRTSSRWPEPVDGGRYNRRIMGMPEDRPRTAGAAGPADGPRGRVGGARGRPPRRRRPRTPRRWRGSSRWRTRAPRGAVSSSGWCATPTPGSGVGPRSPPAASATPRWCPPCSTS